MKYRIPQPHLSKMLQAAHALKEELTLMETIDILWGLARLQYASASLWKSTEIEEDTQYIKDLYHYTEEFIVNHPDALTVLRPL